MKKAALCVILAFIAALVTTGPTHAAQADMSVKVLKKTNCDQRAPRVQIQLAKKAQRVGYGYPDSDVIYWLDTDGVPAGKHNYSLGRQPFGSTREPVMVAAFKGDQGLYTLPALKFSRPAKAECVVTQVHQLTTYKAGVNTVCPKESVTMYIVTVRVKKGSAGYVVRAGDVVLTQRNGKQLSSGGGSIVPRTGDREVQYYVYGSRFSRLQLDPALNKVTLRTSSERVELTGSVYRTCLNKNENA